MIPSHELWRLLDSRKLRTFVMLAKTGSFTLAGREAGISQSGVSHCIRSLESDIGCRLFDRLGKKVHLTPAGEQLLHHAERIMLEMSQARESIQKINKWGQGRLRLAASPAILQYLLPDICAAFKKQFPQMLLSFESCNSSTAIQLVESKAVDVAIALRSDSPTSCHF
ncbi:MAG: LysR family transcriptional regulator, partial [Verrucomicrobia bacterium]|nr:LysR family transcriptional regulator [Verrucomicrobiota bacterium]